MSESMYMARIPFRGERLFDFAKRRGLKTWELDQASAAAPTRSTASTRPGSETAHDAPSQKAGAGSVRRGRGQRP